MVAATSFEGEIYYMRILLNHIRGRLSFDHFKTITSVIAPAFCEAATLHGLLQSDNSLEDCLEEASVYQMPHSLRQLFATIIVYCNPTNPRKLWEQFEQDMSMDFQRDNTNSTYIRTKVLWIISFTLESVGKDIDTFHLVDNDVSLDDDQIESKKINDKLATMIPDEDLLALTTLIINNKMHMIQT